jgi:hypothetical protein
VTVRTGDIGYTFAPKGWSRGCRVLSSRFDEAEIVIHKADQPNTFFDFFDTDSLTSEDRAAIDFFAVKTDTSAAGDVDGFVVDLPQEDHLPSGKTRSTRRRRNNRMCLQDRQVLEPTRPVSLAEMFVAVPPGQDEHPVQAWQPSPKIWSS